MNTMYRVKFAAGDGSVQTVMKTEDLNEANKFKETVNAVLQGRAYVEFRGKRIELHRSITGHNYDA